jgi:hypothetical protein
MSKQKKQFNHAFDFAFEVITDAEFGRDVAPEVIRDACIARMRRLSKEEIKEACNCFDSFEVEA